MEKEGKKKRDHEAREGEGEEDSEEIRERGRKFEKR
jgi:hypothetical protein